MRQAALCRLTGQGERACRREGLTRQTPCGRFWQNLERIPGSEQALTISSGPDSEVMVKASALEAPDRVTVRPESEQSYMERLRLRRWRR